ncbi:MAG: MotA/TolQ/ExbB proton channel family protein [Lachnospiraceae bacterium]|nr:MotA/TolQ/ExbB proton channel family protein [Lachnospiraceae bacterium]
MGRKIIDTLVFLAVAAGCVVLTLVVSNGNYVSSTTIYNFVFLGIIVILYLTALIAGFFRMNHLTEYFAESTDEIEKMRGDDSLNLSGKIQPLLGCTLLEGRLNAFLYDIHHSQSGICDIEDYINEDEIDSLIRKRMLDLVPDILTSLGILGTFMGLVWGLREFEPSNYEAMTASVTSLVDGIKVAFLTSIYGLAMSLVYSYSLKTGYSALIDSMQKFLDRFHTCVVPSAEMEAQNRLVNNQKEQNEILRGMASEFSDQVAHGFAQSIAPTLDRINTSLGGMMTTISRNQQIFLQEIVESFVAEMKKSFHLEFERFGKNLNEMNEVMNRNILYSEKLYQNMCNEMNALFSKEEANMHTAVAELSAIQKKYADSLEGMTVQYRQIMDSYQKAQESAMKNLSTAEQESSRFWVACNQAMQNYLLEAAEAYKKFEKANESSDRMLTALAAIYQKNEAMIEQYGKQVKDFAASQAQMNDTLKELERLLSQIEAAGGDGKSIYLYPGNPRQNQATEQKILQQMTDMLQESGERQEELLQDVKRVVRELSDSTGKKKGWFGR